jgi:hypothetical protein
MAAPTETAQHLYDATHRVVKTRLRLGGAFKAMDDRAIFPNQTNGYFRSPDINSPKHFLVIRHRSPIHLRGDVRKPQQKR